MQEKKLVFYGRINNFNHLFKWLKQKGYQGVIGMEHGNSKKGKEGEALLLDAYRRADDF